MIKEVVINGTVYLANIEEKETHYVVENPLSVALVPHPQTGQMSVQFLPISLLNPTTIWKVPKDHVYAINSIPLELIKAYEETVSQIKIESAKNNTSGKIIKMN